MSLKRGKISDRNLRKPKSATYEKDSDDQRSLVCTGRSSIRESDEKSQSDNRRRDRGGERKHSEILLVGPVRDTESSDDCDDTRGNVEEKRFLRSVSERFDLKNRSRQLFPLSNLSESSAYENGSKGSDTTVGCRDARHQEEKPPDFEIFQSLNSLSAFPAMRDSAALVRSYTFECDKLLPVGEELGRRR